MVCADKVCEYSGEYGYGKMYQYRADLIQVLPKYRDAFKNKLGFLIFFSPDLIDYADDYPCPQISLLNFGRRFHYKTIYLPKFWTRFYWQWRKYGTYYFRPSRNWSYLLYVPEVLGTVYGKYYNSTRNPERALSKICRLVDLADVMHVDFSLSSIKSDSWEERELNTIIDRMDDFYIKYRK